ncbi:MAG: Co2+/Mg2+ efflux protein ApaG [Planctomycetota bacterium]|nr:MAG: Co2+/Mg2+ efflux protein ApaG [Planctomycetota bacterium]
MSSLATIISISCETKSNYLEDYSEPKKGVFLYSYKIKIINHSDSEVKLVSRYWLIIDSLSNKEIIRGDGVVGKQPCIKPGESFEYTSFCPLATNFGTMEGHFHFINEDGNKFDVNVERFYLATSLFEYPCNEFKRGQVVRHKLYNYRGVVVDFDMSFTADDNWYKSNKTKPDKDMPWYHVLVDGSDKVTYVAQQNLEFSEIGAPIVHPLVQHFFNGFETSGYIRNDNSWRELKM